MSMGAIGGAVIGGVLASRAASKSARATQAAGAESTAVQRESLAETKRQYDIGQANIAPYLQAGTRALGQYQGMLSRYQPQVLPSFAGQYQDQGAFQDRMDAPAFGGVSDIPEFTGQVDLESDPGYQFRLSQGLQAIDRMSSKAGQRMSGARGVALSDYAQQSASQEYGAAYGRARDIYGIARQREADLYGRAEGTYAREYGAASDAYGRSLQRYGMEEQRATAGYQRDLGEYGLDYQRTQDLERQRLGHLSMYANLAASGQQAAGASSNLGAQYAAQQANISQGIGSTIASTGQAVGQTQAAGLMGIGSAIQGGLAGYQYQQNFNRYMGNNQYSGYGGQHVAGDAYLPAYRG